MKEISCRDAGADCDFVARAESKDEVMKAVAAHAENDHGMRMTPEVRQKVERLIHDVPTPARRPST